MRTFLEIFGNIIGKIWSNSEWNLWKSYGVHEIRPWEHRCWNSKPNHLLFFILQILAAPILATLAVAIGVPILLFYVYGVVPVSLCRSSGCGVTASTSGVRLDFDEPEYMNQNILANKTNGSQGTSMDAEVVSHKDGNASIGEASLSLGSGTHLEHLGREQDRESSSTVALAGSILAHK